MEKYKICVLYADKNIENNSVVRRINKCNHFFHAECIDIHGFMIILHVLIADKILENKMFNLYNYN